MYLPGLNDQSFLSHFFINVLPYFWDPKEFPLHIIYPHWSEGKSFQKKLQCIVDEVESLTKQFELVSLIGQSAGGSAALNTFAVLRNDVVACVNVTGRLSEGVGVSPTLTTASKNSPAFYGSVWDFEHRYEPTLSVGDRKRVLTLRPRWDEIVPAQTVLLQGATNMDIPMIEHVLAGMYSMTVDSWVIKNFLRRKSTVFKRKYR